MRKIVVSEREPVGVIPCIVCGCGVDPDAERVKAATTRDRTFGKHTLATPPPRVTIHIYFAHTYHDDQQIMDKVRLVEQLERGG